MANILIEIFGTLFGAFLNLLILKLLLFLRQRFPSQTLVGGVVGFSILTVIIFIFSRHPDVGHIATVLGIFVAFAAVIFALLASNFRKTNFIIELSYIFLQMALGLAVLTLLANIIFEISPHLGFDNAHDDKSAYLLIDPLQFSYIATFIIASVIHPVIAGKKTESSK